MRLSSKAQAAFVMRIYDPVVYGGAIEWHVFAFWVAH